MYGFSYPPPPNQITCSKEGPFGSLTFKSGMGFAARIGYDDNIYMEFDDDRFVDFDGIYYKDRVEYTLYVLIAEIFAVVIFICIGIMFCIFLFGLFVAIGIRKKKLNLLPI